MDEEVSMEIEALEAIYCNDFEIDSSNNRRLYVTIKPNPDSTSDEDNLAGYPNELPIIKLNPLRGVTRSETGNLLSQLEQMATENLSTAMLFTLTSFVKEWIDELQTHAQERRDSSDNFDMGDEEENSDEEDCVGTSSTSLENISAISSADLEDRVIAEGTPVTVETFSDWHKKFLEEMGYKKDLEVGAKMTGKKLFEQHDPSVLQDFEDDI